VQATSPSARALALEWLLVHNLFCHVSTWDASVGAARRQVYSARNCQVECVDVSDVPYEICFWLPECPAGTSPLCGTGPVPLERTRLKLMGELTVPDEEMRMGGAQDL